MYIWNINALVTALRENTLSEKQKKNYQITFWILTALTILSFSIVISPSTMNTYDLIDLICFLAINAVGIYILFQIHKKGHKKDFFLPFFSLTIPIFLRTTLLSIGMNIVGYSYILFFAPYHSMEETNLIDIIISIIVEVIFNMMMIHYFKRIYN
ncbi:heme/copper-type cytochrome/quinol oxidase subunit 4 [Peribacillus deserti]|uniref:Heme/copper-type cytochrome/quinol oxidase subunit 4 n=1 Tax=Peribacillus deserti TaxID=673318 RepID=A0ABS2QGJ4_9BACI|nr:hypothetical protein [Peribacillus deserti]MBM7692217.1 heme/copper-type cytochrome/quinol oxidase subunit 4 [Peribacillus deserti]